MPRPDWPTAAAFLPAELTLPALADAAAGCRGCPLWEPATQVVFGSGQPDARLVLVGEQPGDQEDRSGEPFVGPAGRLLDGALEEAGIDRASAYVINAVKHFKFRAAGKAVFGPSFRVTQSRGVLLPWPPSGDESRYGGGQALATLHPSAVLRADDRDAARAGLVADLKVAAAALMS